MNPSVPEGGGTNGQRSKKYTNSNKLGPGGWPIEDPLHGPPIQIESFMHPVNLTENQPSGAKTTFHTHQHSLIAMDQPSRGLEDSHEDGNLGGLFLGRNQTGINGHIGP